MTKKQVKNPPVPVNSRAYPFIEHISELRKRILYSVLAIFVASFASYFFLEHILQFLLIPVDSQQLYYSSPLGAVNFTFEICIITGIILSSPVWLYQMWSFLKPAVPDKWQKKFWWWMLLSSLLAIAGSAYGYFVSLPATLSIIKYFSSEHLTPLLSATEYLSFVSRYLLAFAIFFQVPLILFFASLIGVLTSKKLMKYQRHALVICFVIGAVFTPTPDLINQLLLATPIFILFEISVISIILKEKNQMWIDKHLSK